MTSDLLGVNLAGTIPRKVDLSETDLGEAYLSEADIRKANHSGTDLGEASLSGADLSLAKLKKVNLIAADLSGANLREADLRCSVLVGTNLAGADLTDCWVYGISAWNLTISETIQQDLIITPNNGPDIFVDDLRMAQFIYLLLDNKQILNSIDTITSKSF